MNNQTSNSNISLNTSLKNTSLKLVSANQTLDLSSTRRGFLKSIALAMFASPLLFVMRRAAAETTDLKPADESSPIAAALGFKHDGNTVDLQKFPKKGTPEGKSQVCKQCALYVKGGLKVEGKDGEFGVCSLFPQNVVNAAGWCNSWVAKQGATL